MEQQSKVRKMGSNKLRLAEYRRSVYMLIPDLGVTIEDIKKPDYWSNVAASLRPGDHVEFLADDNSFFVEVLIIDAGQRWAKVHVLQNHQIVPVEHVDTGIEALFDVKWGGNAAKFKVIRLSDRETLKEGLSTKLEAYAWIKDHEKAMAA